MPGDDACVHDANPRWMGIAQRQITLNFDEELLGTDAVQVWPTSPDTEGLAMVSGKCGCRATPAPHAARACSHVHVQL